MHMYFHVYTVFNVSYMYLNVVVVSPQVAVLCNLGVVWLKMDVRGKI